MEHEQLLRSAQECRGTGDDAQAEALFRAAADKARAVFDPAAEARAMLGVGELRAMADDFTAAVEAFNAAASRAMEAGDPLLEAEALHAAAAAYLDAGRSKDAHDALLECMALYRQVDLPAARIGLARATRVYGEHLGVLGSAAEARQALELARIMFADLGDENAVRGVDADLQRLDEYAR